MALLLCGALAVAASSARAVGAPSSPTGSEYLTIPLNDDTAELGTDCPATGGPYWHFVISPNNGESAFITFHLDLGDATTYDTSVFIKNADQWDNVFVAVPAGKELTSLVKDGSSADISWSGTGTEPTKFQLSHVCPAAKKDLSVSKTAEPSYSRTYDWTIDKTADTTTVYSVGGNESDAVNFTVDVTKGEGTDADWAVQGVITVTNPNATAVTGVSLADATSGGTCEVTPAMVDVPANGTATADYACTFADNPGSGTNTVTATWADIGSPSTSATGSADYTFGDPTNVVNDTINVTDTNGQSWEFSGSDSETYAMTYTDPAGTCTSHDNTATIDQTGQSDSVTVEDCQGADLTATKTATPSYDLTYGWQVDKAAVPDSKTVDTGQPATFDYTVTATRDGGTASNWAVAGTVTVTNPNDWQDVEVDVTDALPGADCAVEGGTDLNVPAGDSVKVAYACAVTGGDDGTNTATVTWDADAYHTPNGSVDATADYAFGDPTNLIDDCLAVTDSVAGTLGTACVGDANPKTFTYQSTYTGPAAGTCADKPNTATGTTNDTGSTTSDDATVQVCSYQTRLTPGYWKTHLTYDAKNPNNPWVDEYLPQMLGSYNVDTTKKATVVWNAMNCSNTGSNATMNQNAIGCLAGHLLAAKLNVANGANPCIGTTITTANAFLVTVGYVGPTGNYSTIGATNRTTAITLKTALDAYNNGNGCH